MRSLGHEPTALGVARMYAARAADFVLDVRDGALAAATEELGLRVLVTDTVMEGREGSRRLALDILERAR